MWILVKSVRKDHISEILRTNERQRVKKRIVQYLKYHALVTYCEEDMFDHQEHA